MIWLSFIAEKANFLSILKTVFTFYILSGNHRKIIAGRTQCVVHSFAIFSNNILGITVRMPYVLYKKNHPLSWFTSWIRTYMQDGWGFVGLGDSWTVLFEHNLRNFVAENENIFCINPQDDFYILSENDRKIAAGHSLLFTALLFFLNNFLGIKVNNHLAPLNARVLYKTIHTLSGFTSVIHAL